MELHRAFDGGLRVKLRWERDFEQHVLHHVAAVRALKLERLTPEQHVVETPDLRRQHRWIAHFTGFRDQRETNAAGRGVARRPALSRAGIRRVTISPEALSIDPGEG